MPSSAIQPGFFLPSLDELVDVFATSPFKGDLLQYNGVQWNKAAGVVALGLTLSTLLDDLFSGPFAGNLSGDTNEDLTITTRSGNNYLLDFDSPNFVGTTVLDAINFIFSQTSGDITVSIYRNRFKVTDNTVGGGDIIIENTGFGSAADAFNFSHSVGNADYIGGEVFAEIPEIGGFLRLEYDGVWRSSTAALWELSDVEDNLLELSSDDQGLLLSWDGSRWTTQTDVSFNRIVETPGQVPNPRPMLEVRNNSFTTPPNNSWVNILNGQDNATASGPNDRVQIRAFSDLGPSDIDLDIYAKGSGVVRFLTSVNIGESSAKSLSVTGDISVDGLIEGDSYKVSALVTAGFVKNDASGNFSFGETGGSGTGTSIRETITQTAHGFVAGNVLTHNTTLWIKAKADDATTADALGVVESVTANDFVIVYAGVITIAATFTAGSMHFLSTTTAGAFTTTEPSVGSIVKPVLYGITTGIANVVIQRGIRVSSAQPSITAVKKTTDQTFVATTTLANATDLSFSVISGHYYKFEFDVLFRSTALTTGLKVSVTTPTFTRFGAAVSIPVAVDSVNAQFEGDITSSGDAVSGTDVAATGTDYVAHIEGVIFPSASGTVQVQAACDVAAGTITVRQGSVGLLYDMGV